MLIPLDLIDVPEANVRQHAVSPEQQAELQGSIAALGLLQPVLLRPNGNRYWLVAGRRRLQACAALDFKQIEASVAQAFRPDRVALAQAAENMVRAGMEPLDQWRALTQIRRDGFTLAAAAAALGISERHARKLDKLSSLHPDVVAAIERHGMPEEWALGRIANAPEAVQAAAVKAHGASGGGPRAPWLRIAQACAVARIPRSRAVFNVALEDVAFEEDMFAEADDEDKEFTTEVVGFMQAQRRALEAMVTAARAKKRAAEITTIKDHAIKLPKGMVESHGDPDKPKKGETVLLAIEPAGHNIGTVRRVTVRAAEKAAAAAKAGKAAKAAAKAAEDEAEPATADDDEGDAEAAPQRRGAPAGKPAAEDGASARDPISATGRKLIADAKLATLQKALRTITPGNADPIDLLGLLVIAIGAGTVTIRDGGVQWSRRDMADLALDLVAPGGNLVADSPAVLRLAAEAIARIVWIPPTQGVVDAASEWIGQSIVTDAELPRFDTPEFLQHVAGAELKRLAAEAGLRPAKSVAGLREQLAGALPKYRPAVFGAPGPKPAKAGRA